jgi:DNA mismatch repair protein MutS
MLRQYLELKERAHGALLLYRMGDFYELFFEDAQQAAPVLGIALTRRRHNDEVEAPMCGVPHHALDSYLGKLLTAGFRVSIAEQVEDPATAKGLVRREIIRTHTPGTVSATDLLEGSQHCYLAALGGTGEHRALAWIEVSTGCFEGVRCSSERGLIEQIARLEPKEVLVAEGWNEWSRLWPHEVARPTITPLPAEEFSPSGGEQRLRRVLGVASLRGFGLEHGEILTGMAGALLGYVESTQRGDLKHLRRFRRREPDDALVLDRASLRNLEIERGPDGARRGSLLAVLDHTLTRMGARTLRDWLLRPSIDLEEIVERHRAVAELVEDPRLLSAVRKALENLPDLERLAARVGLGLATPRELHALRAGVELLPGVKAALRRAAAPLLCEIAASLDTLDDVGALLIERLSQDPPATVGSGVIARGWNAELDELRNLARGGKEVLSQIELRERERTGIGSLKVKYNKVFGYYIEVSKANLDRAPADYERRQTLTNAERFTTPELKELEARILSAEERATVLEKELFEALLRELSGHARRVGESAARCAQVDVLASFGDRARRRDYCRPVMEEDGRIIIHEGRHPVLEEVQRDPPFIPNDCTLIPDERQIILLTGPNMGGKSTYLRQVALITLMAHAGSFVPARDAFIGLTDRIFTRVGASDLITRGESTFMVEMTETANILNHASPRSLVILDEVGRGTATFDGLSLAWAIVEYLHDQPDHAARVLFATHYHELTDLARRRERLVNCSMAVKEWRGTIMFLHRVTDGPADRSYGIHVARLAGVPGEVCQRAEDVLATLEGNEISAVSSTPPTVHDRGGNGGLRQLDLFRPAHEEIIDRLQRVQLESTTPIEALNVLFELKARIDRGR